MTQKVNKSISSKIFIGITLQSFIFILVYYIFFLKKLFSFNIIYAPTEGVNIWAIWNLIKSTGLNSIHEWQQSYTGIIYPALVSLLFKITKGTFLSEFGGIILLGRSLSIIGLLITCLSLFLLLKKQKVSFIVRLLAIILFLSLPITQKYSYQITSDLLALGAGSLGFCLFFHSKLVDWKKGILIGFLLASAYALSNQISFLSFTFAALLSLLLLNSFRAFRNIVFPTLIFLGISFVISFLSFSFQRLGNWSLGLWLDNCEFAYSWSLFLALTCFLLIRDKESNFSLNWAHPLGSLLLICLPLAFWETGLKPDYAGGWLIIAFGMCWGFGLLINYLWQEKTGLGLLSLLIALIGILTPLMEPNSLKMISMNSQLYNSTSKWIAENKDEFGEKKARILSQDILLNLRLDLKPALTNFGLFYSSPKSLRKLINEVETLKFSKIILAENAEKILPKQFVDKVKENYLPTEKLLVCGTEGILYEAPRLDEEEGLDHHQFKNKKATYDDKEIFATFSRL